MSKCWESRDQKQCEEATWAIREEQPLLVIGCPPCKMLCNLQALNLKKVEGGEGYARRYHLALERANRYVQSVRVLYLEDAGGRKSLFCAQAPMTGSIMEDGMHGGAHGGQQGIDHARRSVYVWPHEHQE